MSRTAGKCSLQFGFLVLFQKITPVIHIPEGISPPGELADLQRDEIDVRRHRHRDLRRVIAAADVVEDLLVRQCKERILQLRLHDSYDSCDTKIAG